MAHGPWLEASGSFATAIASGIVKSCGLPTTIHTLATPYKI